MTASLRALLEGVLDYAGLFPPAQLPLEEAFRNYLRYRQERESWMLAKFIIPVARLPELEPFLPAEDSATEIPISALVNPSNESVRVFVSELNAQIEKIARFDREHRRGVPVQSIELRVSSNILGKKLSNEELADIKKRIRSLATELGLKQPEATRERRVLPAGNLATIAFAIGLNDLCLMPFFEINLEEDWRAGVSKIARDCMGTPGNALGPGLKLRCGGLDAAAFPTPEQVAFVITACRDALVPLKFTAGLHHPIRHYNDSVKTKMHGFLNVFGAGVLAHRHHLDEEQVRQIIEDEDPANFRFDDECFRWKDYAASIGEIRLARQLAVTSFGSCSFDEPRDDLRKLGLLKD